MWWSHWTHAIVFVADDSSGSSSGSVRSCVRNRVLTKAFYMQCEQPFKIDKPVYRLP